MADEHCTRERAAWVTTRAGRGPDAQRRGQRLSARARRVTRQEAGAGDSVASEALTRSRFARRAIEHEGSVPLRTAWAVVVEAGRLALAGPGIGLSWAIYGLWYRRVGEWGPLRWRWLAAAAGAALIPLAVVAGIRGEAAERRIAPNQGIRTSARNAAVVAAAVAFATAIPLLAITFGFGPPPAPPLHTPEALEATRLWRAHPLAFFVLIELCIAITLGLFAGMHRGGLVVVSHGVLRLLLAVTRRLPLRLVATLERASSHALLRKTGGGYIFVHDELREHLAGMHAAGALGGQPEARASDVGSAIPRGKE